MKVWCVNDDYIHCKGNEESTINDLVCFDDLEQLNSECFIYENWESNWWNLFDIDYVDSMNIDIVKKYIKEYAIGYCDGIRLKFRPRENSFAIMFEKDGNKFWFHIEKWVLNN